MSGICTCSPAVDAEMDDWVAAGGGNSGCCGDPAHFKRRSGFHLPGWAVSASDYSRRHEPGLPANMDWACAGDFRHGGDPRLRAMHAVLLTRLMRGDPGLAMICEFIGQPWPDQPVYYWAAWQGRGELKAYTGPGHGTWSHVSWYRSRADQRAYLWQPNPGIPVVVPVARRPDALRVDGVLGPQTISRWQRVMGTTVDGVISRPRSQLVVAVQRHLNAAVGAGLAVDGAGIHQDGRRSYTIRALQRYLGTPADGRLSTPRSMAVQALQRRLNTGRF